MFKISLSHVSDEINNIASGHRLPIKSHNSLNSKKMFSNYAQKVLLNSAVWFVLMEVTSGFISHTALLLNAIHNASYKVERKEVRERAALKLQLLSI